MEFPRRRRFKECSAAKEYVSLDTLVNQCISDDPSLSGLVFFRYSDSSWGGAIDVSIMGRRMWEGSWKTFLCRDGIAVTSPFR